MTNSPERKPLAQLLIEAEIPESDRAQILEFADYLKRESRRKKVRHWSEKNWSEDP